MWLVSGLHEVFSYVGWQLSRIEYEAMWLVSGLHKAFSYGGWQVGSSKKLCGWLVGFLRDASTWPVQESGMKLCDQCTHCM